MKIAAEIIKEKILDAVVHVLVFGVGLVVLYAISIVFVGDAKFRKEHDDTVERESQIIVRMDALEHALGSATNKVAVAAVTTNNAPTLRITLPALIEGVKNAQAIQKQYKSENRKP